MLTAAYTGRRLPERPGTTVNRCMQGSHFRAFVLNLTAPAAISLSGPEGSTVVVAPTQYRDYCCVFQLPSFMVSAAGVRTIDLSSAAPTRKERIAKSSDSPADVPRTPKYSSSKLH